MARTISDGLLVLTFLLSGTVFAQGEAAAEAEPDGEESTAEALTFDREGESCVVTRAINSTDIIDDRTIIFEMRGGEYYLNNLAYECRGLRFARGFSYSVSTGRLCSVDTITVLRRGNSCGLGTFYPITEEEAELLKAEADERRGRPRPEIQVENPNALEEDEETD